MVLDGRTITEKGIVTWPQDNTFCTKEQIQPNGIDLRVIQVSLVEGHLKVPREASVSYNDIRTTELPWKDAWLTVKPGLSYIVEFNEFISVKDGFCAIIEPRSSLIRSGINFKSGVWDTGFEGRLGGVLRPLNTCSIEYGARLAQVQVFESTFNGHRYEGRYQGATSRTAIMKG